MHAAAPNRTRTRTEQRERRSVNGSRISSLRHNRYRGGEMRVLLRTTSVLVSLFFFPALAWAQATIAGTVRDTSGAVLPGVTVEAASPALIEKVRTAVTDGSGQYRIEDLRPGNYSVTFTLTGFSSVKRDNIELTGSFVATIGAEMREGSLEETILVTAESPI